MKLCRLGAESGDCLMSCEHFLAVKFIKMILTRQTSVLLSRDNDSAVTVVDAV
jgi:hypothetical protein